MGTTQQCRLSSVILLCAYSIVPPATADVSATLINHQLDQPTGVAVQPGTGHVFVSESGTGRIVRVNGESIQAVIEGFSIAANNDEPFQSTGPLGLLFLDAHTLVVGSGGNPVGQDALRIFRIDPESTAVLRVTDGLSLGMLEGTNEGPALGDFWSVATSPGAIWLTTRGDRQQGWLARTEVKDAQQLHHRASFGELTRMIATQLAAEGTEPHALAVSPAGEVVVGHCGKWGPEPDSRLSFYRATDGKLLLDASTGRRDLVALAYGAPTGPANIRQLYGLDFAAADVDEGGLYRLESSLAAGRIGIKSRKIVELKHPLAMAFQEDGSLWIVGGHLKGQPTDQRGGLWQIDAGL